MESIASFHYMEGKGSCDVDIYQLGDVNSKCPPVACMPSAVKSREAIVWVWLPVSELRNHVDYVRTIMAKGRVRTRVRGPKAGKATRWRKGHSSSSNPTTKKHRLSAKGRFSGHLAQPHGAVSGPTLTAQALASHDASQENEFALDR